MFSLNIYYLEYSMVIGNNRLTWLKLKPVSTFLAPLPPGKIMAASMPASVPLLHVCIRIKQSSVDLVVFTAVVTKSYVTVPEVRTLQNETKLSEYYDILRNV
jgi:hypothetical protein